MKIVSVKKKLNNHKLLQLLALSVYNPTEERLEKRTKGYSENTNIKALALKQGKELVGLIVFEVKDKTAVICDFGVRADRQKQGIGSKLLNAIPKRFNITEIKAETDDDAVGFYEKCGFESEKTESEFETKRYSVTKNVTASKSTKALHFSFRALLLLVGVVVTANGLLASVISGAIMTIVATFLVGFFFLFCGFGYNWLRRNIPLVIRIFVLLCVVFAISVVSFIYIYGKYDNVDYKEDAVIVLGAGLRGENLSLTLKNRLDVAIDYHSNNPDAMIVVSGGQGYGETVTEGYAMEKYLLEQGIPSDKIIREEKSTSTEENFRFSKELLDKHFDGEYRLAYVTNDFHIYRAGEIAEKVGINDTTHCHSTALAVTFLPNGFREFLAVMKMWVFG